MIPDKLKSGDEIRVIAPSQSLEIISHRTRNNAIQRFRELGMNITFGKNVEKCDMMISSSIEDRLQDLHEAFADTNVKGIFSAIGGYNSNHLLDYIDFELIKNNPKVFCGYSDISVLQNAIFHKTGLVIYSGLHFSTFGMKQYFDYNMKYFKKCLMQGNEFEIKSSCLRTDDARYIDQDKRNVFENSGYVVINDGEAQGKIVGGNLVSFGLLKGTQYMPDLTNTIFFMEDDAETGEHFGYEFDRNLQSLIHQPNFDKVKGIVIGRVPNGTDFSREKLEFIIKSKKQLKNIPIIANADFGHTNPMFTFPIGGEAKISASDNGARITILRH